ncbi:MAG: DUF4150 domain-containing protein [Polyangiaceae bacterium]|nr:DUF4150 domain-containing protein [Polyangiaceae bacterium]
MVSVAVNGRTVVHQQSGGVSVAFPDVCLTPPANLPIPYVNVGLSKYAGATAASVFCDHQPVMKASSYFSETLGDEPGTGGGVISGRVKGKASFSNFSFDVLIEGEPTPRALDPMVHNHGSQPNAASRALCQDTLTEADLYALCFIFCICENTGGKTACLDAALGVPRPAPLGFTYDAWWPTFLVEPTFLMLPVPVPLPSGAHSRFYPGKELPQSAWWVDPDDVLDVPDWGGQLKGMRRPDIVSLKNPLKPAVHGNIAAIFEAKFKGDRWREGQEEAYHDIAGTAPVILLRADTCGCTGGEGVPVPVEAPEESKEKKPKMGPGTVVERNTAEWVAAVLALAQLAQWAASLTPQGAAARAFGWLLKLAH